MGGTQERLERDDTTEVVGTEGAFEGGGAQERIGGDDTIGIFGMEGGPEEGGAQERIGEDDTMELWEWDDTRGVENGRFLDLR